MQPIPSRTGAARRAAPGVLALLVALVGCHTQPLPLSAQAGSTVVIPVGGGFGYRDLMTPVGFGGSEVADPQRGAFVFRLGGPSGFELETRAAFEVESSDRAALAAQQILAVVDIPPDAPVGSHALHLSVRREREGIPTEVPVTPPYEGGITILPHEIEIEIPGGGTETVVGTPTPAEDFRLGPGGKPYGWQPTTPFKAVPRPAFRVYIVSPARDPGDRRWTAGAVVDVTYPADTIEIADVVSSDPLRTTTWWESRSPGRIRVYATALHAGEVSPFWVVFDLVDPDRPLRTGIATSVVTAADQFGSEDVAAEWQVVAGIGEIR